MSKKAYQAMDLGILTLIAAVSEALSVALFNLFPAQVFSVSVVAVVALIAIYRWNAWGLLVGVIGGGAGALVRFLMKGTVTLGFVLSSTVAYLFLAIVLLFFIRVDKNAIIKEKKWFKFAYFFAGFATLEIGRAVCQIGNADFWSVVGLYYAYDLLNVLFGLAVFLLSTRQPNMVVDMNEYLVALKAETAPVKAAAAKAVYESPEGLSDNDETSDIALLDGGVLTAEDLRVLNETKRKAETGDKRSHFDVENETVASYQNHKKSGKEGQKSL